MAVARKLAVILHRMWTTGERFRWTASPGRDRLLTVAFATHSLPRSETSSLPGRASATARFFPRHSSDRVRDIAASNPRRP